MKTRELSSVLVFFGLLFGMVNASEACNIIGKVVYTYQNASALYAYVSPQTSSQVPMSYVYYYVIPTTTIASSVMANRVSVAQANNQKVYFISSNTCPTTGTVRYAGQATAMYGYSLY